jgi:ketosteroid isomerase-like protein
MHPHAALLQRLFTALDQHDHKTMASCYHPDATFHDIAFDLRGGKQIHTMWHMICEGDIHAIVEEIDANEREGRAKVVDRYTFGAKVDPPRPGRPVRNIIESRFRFHDGRIIEQNDDCDAQEWARMALGGPIGWAAGRMRPLRALTARKKLDAFISRHPEYRDN